MHLLFSYARGARFQGGRCPPWIPLRFRRNRRGYPPLVRTADEAAPPRRGQWSKSPAEPDFYGDFLCGALRSACPACFAFGKMRQEISSEKGGAPERALSFLFAFSRVRRRLRVKRAWGTLSGTALFLPFSKKLSFRMKLLHFIHKRHLTLGRSGDKLCLALREMEC